MNDDQFRPIISVSAHAALELAKEVDAVKVEMERVCSRFGLLSQKYLILTDALQLTIKDINGGTYPAPLNQQHFPELNSR